MNRNDFLNMIVERVPVNRQMMSDVYELIDIFPYFQSAHMLLLKGLHTSEDVKFENQLRSSAIHIADREVLYYLLKTKPSPEVNHEEIKHEIISSEDFGNKTQQTVIESAKNSQYLINEIEKNSDEKTLNDLHDTRLPLSGHSILISSESFESDGVMFMIDEEVSPSEDKVFFMDPGFSVPDRSDLLELDLDDSKSGLTDEVIINEEQLSIEERISNRKLQSDLIEKFIIANPRIEPVKEKINLPAEDLSKPYVEAEGGFVTETLARIFINQGYYSKAIDIYEKLSLKFPEKSSYFASQIEKVKEYIKK